jgi:hypothetical protein
MPTTIEEIWSELRRSSSDAQRRVDADHPLDLYADFERPNRPGLVLFCDEKPGKHPILRAIRITCGQRPDGRWSLRIFLDEPQLLAVFSELCRDIVESTRRGRGGTASGAVLSRLDRWRTLMQAQSSALSESVIKGLIGELLFLEHKVFPVLEAQSAVATWTGPLGAEQDFRFPSGMKIEVKAIDRDAGQVRINGLGQLDGGADPSQLAIVRLERTGRDAADALTLETLIQRLRRQLSDQPAALADFETSLGFAGWRDGQQTDSIVVRLSSIETHEVHGGFPRLTRETVPAGILQANYDISLPAIAETT